MRTHLYDSTCKKVLRCQKGAPLIFGNSSLFMWRSVNLKFSPGHGKGLKDGLDFDMGVILSEK